MPGRDEIISRTRTAADASTSADVRAALGTPGQRIQVRGATKDTGLAYIIPGVLDTLLTGIGGALDGLVGAGVGFAVVSTNGAGVAPTLTAALRVNSASKNPADQSLTLGFSPAYTAAPVVAAMLDAHGSLYYTEVVVRTSSSVRFIFRDGLGAALVIDSRTVLLLAVGS